MGRSALGLSGLLLATNMLACVRAGESVPAPEGDPRPRSVVIVERIERAGTFLAIAEARGIGDGRRPEVFLRSSSDLVWLLYEESLEELGLPAGPLSPNPEVSGRLRPHRAELLSSDTHEWSSLEPNALPGWVGPFLPHLPCVLGDPVRNHRFPEFTPEFQPMDGRRPALTALVPLDETHALVASAVGIFYRVEWPFGGEVSLVRVETSTPNYHLGAFRRGDSIYLGGTGARVAEAERAPLLDDPPRLVLRRELGLADRAPSIDNAVVSIVGDPNGAEDLFFMTESTEVFHLGPTGVKSLGAMDSRRPQFDFEDDRQLRARQLAWVGPRQAVAVWFYDQNHRSDPGPILLDADGRRTPLPLPLAAAEFFASATSVAFDPQRGLFVARSSFQEGGLRAELFHRPTLAEDWSSFAVVDFAVQDMVIETAAVFAVGGLRYFSENPGAGMRAQRGFHFKAPAEEEERCLWFRPNGRQRLAVRLSEGRMVSVGTTVDYDPPWIFTHELEIPHTLTPGD